MLIVAFIVFAILNPRFAQPATISLILQQIAVVAALAIGQTLIILTAGIDLSVGAICRPLDAGHGQAGRQHGVPGCLALLIGIAVGTACGFLNGLLVTRLNLPPFIVTLGTLSIFTALALLYSGGASIQADQDARPAQPGRAPASRSAPFSLTTGWSSCSCLLPWSASC